MTTPVRTPNTFPETDFSDFFSAVDKKPDILLTHQPPYDTVSDIVMGSRHVGSRAIRSFIDRKGLGLCLCGHIHESAGAGYCGKTLVVNPGPFKSGFYSIITVDESGRYSADLLKA